MPGKQTFPMDRRRRLLLQALSSGILVGGLGWNRSALAQLLGEVPGRLPQGKSIFRLRGVAWVNGEPASRETTIAADDRVATGENSELVVVIGSDAFILRENTEVEFSLAGKLKQGLQVITGAMLSVFAPRDNVSLELHTPVVAVGIRGTGLYVESQQRRSYICNCYGRVEIAARDDPSHRETIVSRHHDAPRWVLAEPEKGERILPAPFINHEDMELVLLESLVGRAVPFGAQGRSGQGRGRGY